MPGPASWLDRVHPLLDLHDAHDNRFKAGCCAEDHSDEDSSKPALLAGDAATCWPGSFAVSPKKNTVPSSIIAKQGQNVGLCNTEPARDVRKLPGLR